MKRATETFFTEDIQIYAGQILADDDPIVEGREAYFVDHEEPRSKRGAKARSDA